MASVSCIECEGDIPLEEDVMAGEILQCPHCGSELEVVSLNPVKLDLAPEVQEDWGE